MKLFNWLTGKQDDEEVTTFFVGDEDTPIEQFEAALAAHVKELEASGRELTGISFVVEKRKEP
jgi:hypothetical protein